VFEDGDLECTWIYESIITPNADSIDTFTLITTTRKIMLKIFYFETVSLKIDYRAQSCLSGIYVFRFGFFCFYDLGLLDWSVRKNDYFCFLILNLNCFPTHFEVTTMSGFRFPTLSTSLGIRRSRFEVQKVEILDSCQK